MAITKATAQGEQLVVDVCQWNPVSGDIVHDSQELQKLFDEMCKFADVRVLEMNTRVIEAYDFRKYLTNEEWRKIGDILEVLSGRVNGSTVLARWQSVIEENEALLNGRMQAQQQELGYL